MATSHETHAALLGTCFYLEKYVICYCYCVVVETTNAEYFVSVYYLLNDVVCMQQTGSNATVSYSLSMCYKLFI